MKYMRDIRTDFVRWMRLRERNILTEEELIYSMMLEAGYYEDPSAIISFLNSGMEKGTFYFSKSTMSPFRLPYMSPRQSHLEGFLEEP
ncbi:MAG: hypothetical protein AB7G28_18790 [Pirellulales bacterium]